MAPVAAEQAGWLRRGVRAALIGAAHVAAVLSVAFVAARPQIAEPVRALAVRVIEPEAPQRVRSTPEPARTATPSPVPRSTLPARPRQMKALPTPPVLAARREVASASSAAPQSEPATTDTPEQPRASPAAPVTPPTSAPISAARFDAAYLQNPRPDYPPISRRLHEEGRVVLRVRVGAQGLPLAIQISTSSGFVRLDEAARAAVERWRFIPARQGGEAIEASVLVPLQFTLTE